jgi:hypothetical protein
MSTETTVMHKTFFHKISISIRPAVLFLTCAALSFDEPIYAVPFNSQDLRRMGRIRITTLQVGRNILVLEARCWQRFEMAQVAGKFLTLGVIVLDNTGF